MKGISVAERLNAVSWHGPTQAKAIISIQISNTTIDTGYSVPILFHRL